ncbi:MAG: tetratricopeptide repeat protein [Candidatus Methanoperedens sp.]|nr:tetratricopeptide repeat protein [Candidatus Methanoperedens sp.]MCZ7369250.1 tetratricopeptide repeat protein [Candidatus Methanoperedens sp.]
MEEVRKVQIRNFIKKEFNIEIDEKYIEDYDEALTHYNDNRTKGTRKPERLAFLGDSYLEYIVRKYLFHKDNFNLGQMDSLKQGLVGNENGWRKIAEKIGLGEQMVYIQQNQRIPRSIYSTKELARSFEALAAVLSYDCPNNAEEKLIALFIKLGYLQNLSKPDDLGRLEEALATYDKAIEINPKDEKAWVDKGSALDDLGREEEALVCYDKAIEINPKDARVWSLKSWALDDLGRDEEAEACRDKVQNLFRCL